MKQLGKQLKEAREALRVSTYKLEIEGGIHPSFPKKIESGESVTTYSLEKYVRAINKCSENGSIEVVVKTDKL